MSYIKKDEWTCDFVCDRCGKSAAQEIIKEHGEHKYFPAITKYGIELWRTELIDKLRNAIINHNQDDYAPRKIEMPDYSRFINYQMTFVDVPPPPRTGIFDKWRYNKRNNTMVCGDCAMIINKKAK
jgi:hypothetical protein